MLRLETQRLVLRNYQKADLQDFHEYMSLEYTARQDNFEPLSLEQCRRLLNKRLKKDNCLVVELKALSKVIGDIGFNLEEFSTYTLSADFNLKFEKQGYATEACTAVIQYLFGTLNGRRIYGECNDDNLNSRRLMQRLGFRQEGHFLQDLSFKTGADGQPIYVNSCLYAILKPEWLALHPG